MTLRDGLIIGFFLACGLVTWVAGFFAAIRPTPKPEEHRPQE